MASHAFIAFQKNEESRCIVEAIVEDNPGAIVSDQPAMVKIDVPGHLVVRKSTIEEEIGRAFDLQEMQVHMITMSGNLDQTDDEMILYWNA